MSTSFLTFGVHPASADPKLAFEEFTDATEYEFGSPPTGRKVMINYCPEIWNEERFWQEVKETDERIAGYSQGKLIDKGTEKLETGQAVYLVFAMPPVRGIEAEIQEWLGMLHFWEGDSAKLVLWTPSDDRDRKAEFWRLLKSVRKTTGKRDPLAAVRQAIAATVPERPTTYPAGPISLELTGDYVRPTEFLFETPSHDHFRLKLTDRASAFGKPIAVKAGAIETVHDEDGKEVHIQKARDLWSQRPSARKKAILESSKPVYLQISVENDAADVSELTRVIERELSIPR